MSEFAFLLLENPIRLNSAIEFLFTNIQNIKSNDVTVFILTKIKHNLILVNPSKISFDIIEYTYSNCTPKIFNEILKRKNVYCFFEASSDLAKYEHQNSKINCLIIGTEISFPNELYISARFMNGKCKEDIECLQYLRKIGKIFSGIYKIEKQKNIFISRRLINFTTQKYSLYLCELANIPKDELNRERILETMNNFEKLDENKLTTLFRTLAINEKQIIFSRFPKHISKAYNLFNGGKKCFIYSKTNNREMNITHFNEWLKSSNGILFLCISENDPFWTYDIRKLNSIVLLETFDDNFLLKFHQLVDVSTGYCKNFWSAMPSVDIISMCYQSPDGTELIEEEYFTIVTKKNEVQKLFIELLKNGFSSDVMLENINQLFQKDLLKTDYLRMFPDKLSSLI